MKISKRARREGRQLFRTCYVEGVLDENRVRELVRELIERKPRRYLAILRHLERLVRLELIRRRARVEGAVTLSEDLQQQFHEALGRLYGPGLNVSFAEDPALIGGVRVKVGYDVYDGSVRGRLEALKEHF